MGFLKPIKAIPCWLSICVFGVTWTQLTRSEKKTYEDKNKLSKTLLSHDIIYYDTILFA